MADLPDEDDPKIRRIKLLQRVVCICKGIPLGRVLKGMKGCTTVAEVNRRCGTGSGGCQGQRCGPRIETLLRKMAAQKARDANQDSESELDPETALADDSSTQS